MHNKMSNTDKQYGLIEPKTGKKLTVSDVFNNDSDSGDEKEGNLLKKLCQKEEKGLKKQTKLEMQRALEQDPTVYQYDEIYDEMAQRKQELEEKSSNTDKKPKYINELLKTADRRKRENERRLERQIQKEREAEGDMYKDKEEYITSSYKQKLEEFKKAEEEERKMEYIESIMDVSKQQDLGGFYRHLYKETISNQNADNVVINESETKEEYTSIEEPDVGAVVNDKSAVDTNKHERHYRKRNCSDSIDGGKKMKQESSSLSSDSDSSSDSSSTSSSSEEEKTEVNSVKLKQNETKPEQPNKETLENIDKGKREVEKANEKSLHKNSNPQKDDGKSEIRDDRSRNCLKSSKPDDRNRRDRNYRSSVAERDRVIRNQGRDDRGYRDRERDRREDRRIRDRSDRRSSDYRRRRSRTPERRDRNKSRERSSERSRSKRGQERGNDVKDEKAKKDLRKRKKETEIETKRENEIEEQVKISIWEKRTVGSVLEAALERYKQRKTARGS